MPAPTFLCIGAQKCGTTWLVSAVAQHPRSAPAARSELHFFDQRARYERGIAWYERQFRVGPRPARSASSRRTTGARSAPRPDDLPRRGRPGRLGVPRPPAAAVPARPGRAGRQRLLPTTSRPAGSPRGPLRRGPARATRAARLRPLRHPARGLAGALPARALPGPGLRGGHPSRRRQAGRAATDLRAPRCRHDVRAGRHGVQRNVRLSDFEMRLRHASPELRREMEQVPEGERNSPRWTISVPEADRHASPRTTGPRWSGSRSCSAGGCPGAPRAERGPSTGVGSHPGSARGGQRSTVPSHWAVQDLWRPSAEAWSRGGPPRSRVVTPRPSRPRCTTARRCRSP